MTSELQSGQELYINRPDLIRSAFLGELLECRNKFAYATVFIWKNYMHVCVRARARVCLKGKMRYFLLAGPKNLMMDVFRRKHRIPASCCACNVISVMAIFKYKTQNRGGSRVFTTSWRCHKFPQIKRQFCPLFANRQSVTVRKRNIKGAYGT